MTLASISRRLARDMDALRFAPPVAHVYNPLRYARRAHEAYLRRFGTSRGGVLLVGMNPGPWGMAQTGVPFGDVTMVRDWMGIEARVEVPRSCHPKRPVQGFACTRSEVSGTRLWSWARRRFGEPERFFERFFVWNLCPLAFLEASGRNRTPDKLPAPERGPLLERCDEALRAVAGELEPRWVVGIGAFAERRARQALGGALPVGRILHPSPASPVANRGWEAAAEKGLSDLGIPLAAPRTQAGGARPVRPRSRRAYGGGRTYVARSPIHGRGLFAARAIARGEPIGVFEGERAKRNGPYVLWLEEDDGSWRGIRGTNEIRFANHSARPNAELDGTVLRALRRIAPDEEITLHYGDDWA